MCSNTVQFCCYLFTVKVILLVYLVCPWIALVHNLTKDVSTDCLSPAGHSLKLDVLLPYLTLAEVGLLLQQLHGPVVHARGEGGGG